MECSAQKSAVKLDQSSTSQGNSQAMCRLLPLLVESLTVALLCTLLRSRLQDNSQSAFAVAEIATSSVCANRRSSL
jgi:hypothetical protein